MLALVACVVSGSPYAQPVPRFPVQDFVAPVPGSYRLEVIQHAPKGIVLESNGRSTDISRFVHGRITLLSFIYTYCSDPVGCPLAYATFTQLRAKLLANPALANRVRFVSLSFDPVNDTPDAMRNYAGELALPVNGFRWHFLTSRSISELRPIIAALGQDVSLQTDASGQPTRFYNHLLKVFLIDSNGQIREIYTTAFLHPEVMLNDIKTLALEEGVSTPRGHSANK